MEISLQLFGPFRVFGEKILLQLVENPIVSDVREALAKKLFEMDCTLYKKGLLDASRFATETEILHDTSPLKEGEIIAIIPPVSGG